MTVILRKSNKSDCPKPKAYRPISFLKTVSKEFDVVVARRLSYLAETCRLPAENQLGGWSRRSVGCALNLLIEKIHEAL